MAAIEIEKIPALTGKKAKDFVLATEKPKRVQVSEQQAKMYASFQIRQK